MMCEKKYDWARKKSAPSSLLVYSIHLYQTFLGLLHTYNKYAMDNNQVCGFVY